MTRRERIFEVLDRHDKNFTLESGEVIQAIYFYDFEKVIDELEKLLINTDVRIVKK